MKIQILSVVAAVAALCAWSAPARSAPKPVETASCIEPTWIPTDIRRIGPYTYTCRTYFLGIVVHTSTVSCQTSIRTTPGHYKCSDAISETVDCLGSVNSVIESTQKYKARCKGQTGLNIEVGGVEIGIDWWEAVCEVDGAPINVVMMTDSSIPCQRGDVSGSD